MPRGEVEVADARVHHDGARVGDAVRLDGAPVGAVQFGNLSETIAPKPSHQQIRRKPNRCE